MYPYVSYRVYSRFRRAYWSPAGGWIEDPRVARVFLSKGDPELKQLLASLRKPGTRQEGSKADVVVSTVCYRRKKRLSDWHGPSEWSPMAFERGYYARFDDWGQPVGEVIEIDGCWVQFAAGVLLGKTSAVNGGSLEESLRWTDKSLLRRGWKIFECNKVYVERKPRTWEHTGQCSECGSFGAPVRQRDASNTVHWFHHRCFRLFTHKSNIQMDRDRIAKDTKR